MLARNYAGSTQLLYAKILRKFLGFIAAQSVVVVDSRVVRSFLAQHRADGGSARSLYQLRGALRSFYRFLILGGIAHASPAQHIPVPKITRRLPRVPSPSEIELLLAAAVELRDRAILELFYASGLRLSELAKLRIEQMDLDALTLMVRGGKGNKDGLAFLNEKCASTLRAYIGGRSRGPLFRDPRGQPLSTVSIYQIVRRTARRAGLEDVGPHSLRHAFATHLLNHGADIRYVQEFLRHKKISTTQIYAHSAIEDLVKMHAQFHPHGGSNEKE
ncbi:MAG: tyrosine-type recombinase/integrase [Candidatus Acidiferrales bacterium]